MLLETLLVVFSMIAMGSLFFLIYITWTLNDSLQDNDNVINEMQDEIDRLTKIINKNQKELFEEYNQ
jgi:cell division protein FtsL